MVKYHREAGIGYSPASKTLAEDDVVKAGPLVPLSTEQILDTIEGLLGEAAIVTEEPS
jgi:hypothetical protein